MGACVIEKHFSLDKTLKGNDHYHSATPEDLKELITESEIAWSMRGNGLLDIENVQLEARQQARRSIYAAVDIEKGKKISEEMLIMLRPGTGLPPTEIDNVVGRIAKQDIPAKSKLVSPILNLKIKRLEDLAERLYDIPRSVTGEGQLKTLKELQTLSQTLQ